MNSKTRWILAVAATSVVAVGVLAVAGPAIAGAGPFGTDTVATAGVGPGGNRNGNGAGGHGIGPGMGSHDGDCPMATTAASGTLTEAQQTTLAAMAEKEKLSVDLYQAFADRYPAAIFDRIAAAEGRHLTALRTLLERYGLADPTAGKAAGQFTTAEVQASYDRLLAQGLTSQSAALDVGQQVEKAGIADLQVALAGLTTPDAQVVYQHLLAASRRHLSAFTVWSTR